MSATATCVHAAVETTACQPLDTLRVTASVPLTMFTPLIGQIMTAVGLNPITLTSVAEVMVNN